MQQIGDAENEQADLELVVDARLARLFGDRLVATVEQAGGRVDTRAITGEDLTKQIIDVEARLRGRQILADRLLGIVKTHQGSIADLVAAQKALADVQQEIDTARAELAGARGRVAMSTVRIDYRASAGMGGFTTPITNAFADLGSVAGMSVAALLSFLAAILPWLVPTGLAIFLFHWWKRRSQPE